MEMEQEDLYLTIKKDELTVRHLHGGRFDYQKELERFKAIIEQNFTDRKFYWEWGDIKGVFELIKSGPLSLEYSFTTRTDLSGQPFQFLATIKALK